MNSIIIALFSLLMFALGYYFYASFIERKVWKVDHNKPVPAVENYDGLDYVPAKHWSILFGHHFSSIAGAGPIIGPVIACAVFGWGPALLWIILGSIFIGGIHDFSSLMLSVRHGGNTVGHITENILSKRSRLVFSFFLWLALIMVVAVFSAVTAQTFIAEPKIVVPTFGLIAIAMLFGWLVYYRQASQIWTTLLCLILMAATIYIGTLYPIIIPGPQALTVWIIILLLYSFIASVTPVNILLQPRDYLSAFILVFGLILGYLGVFITAPNMQTPFFTGFKSSQGPLWPMMFVLIACGAISGFHSLISSGTTSKQLPHKSMAKRITFGAMLLEGVMAVLAVICVCAGLYWFGGPQGLVYPELVKEHGWIFTFGKGFGQIVAPLVGSTFGMLIAIFTLNAFVLTTLDTATRITRYITEEMFGTAFKIKIFGNPYFSTAVVVLLALWLALGSWTAIWPIFGASNQLIAAIVLIVVSVYLFQKNQPTAYTLYPAIFMTITSIGALIYQLVLFYRSSNYLLLGIDIVLLSLTADILLEAYRVVRKI